MEEPNPDTPVEESYEGVETEVTIETDGVIQDADGNITHVIKYEEDGTQIMEVEQGEDGRDHIIVASLDNDHQVVIENVEEVEHEEVPSNVMYIASEVGVEPEETHHNGEQSDDYEPEYQRPVRPVERQKMRPWLMDLLDKGNIQGLSWQNRDKRIFRISWKHAAHNCFNKEKDSDLFERWAYHTGRHHEGNHKRWKANFRCALNSLPDVIELRDLGVRKGDNAFKVYKFIDLSDKKGQEEKKRQQVINAMTMKTTRSKATTTTGTPRQVKSESNSPSSVPVIRAEGMLQTLLHAIELKNQEASVEDGTTVTVRTRGGVKRGISEKVQMQGKKRVKQESDASEDESALYSQDSSSSKYGISGAEGHSNAKSDNDNPGGGKSKMTESVITVPASLLSSLGKGISSGQIPLVTSGGQIIQLSTLLAASLAEQQTKNQPSPSTSKAKLTPLIQKVQGSKTVAIPKTVLDALRSSIKPLAEEGQGDSKNISSDHTSHTKEPKPGEPVRLELNKEWTSLASYLRKPTTTTEVKVMLPEKQSVTSIPVSTVSGNSGDIRGKLVSWLNIGGQPISASTTVRHPTPSSKQTAIKTEVERVIVRPNTGSDTPGSKIITTTTGTLLSPSAVVQRVEQLGDINVNIKNVDSDVELPESGSSTPQPVDGSTISQSVETNTVVSAGEEPCTVEVTTEEVTDTSQHVVEEGQQQDILTEQVTIELGNVENQITKEACSEDTSQQYSGDGVKEQYLEEGDSIIIASGEGDAQQTIKLTKIGDKFYMGEGNNLVETDFTMEDQTEEVSSQAKTDTEELSSDILQQAMTILTSSPVYRTFSHKLVKTSNATSLIISNNWYFGILGEEIDPLTVTLTKTGQLTLSIVFKPVEKMAVLTADGHLDEQVFRGILDQMTKNRFCPGIPYSKILPECNMESMVVFSHPFLRYQSMDCPVWFEGQTNLVSTVPIHKCTPCQELFKLLGRQVSSIKRKKRKQEEQQEVEENLYREEIVEATASVM